MQGHPPRKAGFQQLDDATAQEHAFLRHEITHCSVVLQCLRHGARHDALLLIHLGGNSRHTMPRTQAKTYAEALTNGWSRLHTSTDFPSGDAATTSASPLSTSAALRGRRRTTTRTFRAPLAAACRCDPAPARGRNSAAVAEEGDSGVPRTGGLQSTTATRRAGEDRVVAVIAGMDAFALRAAGLGFPAAAAAAAAAATGKS